ncbi:MAG: hypothetical protein H6704_25880 [Myxococcales bacterium]|nr:hypothetical protein [Myxococcales bacterium]
MQERLLTLGVMGLGLAHELQSPLTATALGLELLALRLRGDDPPGAAEVADEVERTLERVRRMAALVQRMRAFAKAGGGADEAVDLNRAADEALALTRPALSELSAARLVRGAQDAVPLVRGDRLLLEQAIGCLIINAADALGAAEGAERTVTVAVRRLADGAALEVLDDGPGFPDAEAARAPGVSSKGEAGMGVGLALVELVARDAGAILEIGNRPDGGARAALRFHVDSGKAEDAEGTP